MPQAQGTSRQGLAGRVDHLRTAAYHYACKQGLSTPDAEECAQACIVRLIEQTGTNLLPESSVRNVDAWLYRLVLRDVQDYVRLLIAKRSHVILHSEMTHLDGTTATWEPQSPAPTPEEALERSILSEHLFAAIRSLDRDCYCCFTLRHLLGWSVTEIATALRVSPNHVSKILPKAARALRKYLDAQEIGQEELMRGFSENQESPSPAPSREEKE